MKTSHENDFVMDNNLLYQIHYKTVLLLGIYRGAVGESVSVRSLRARIRTNRVRCIRVLL